MVKAGFGDSIIVKMIDSHGAAFDLSVDGLLKLKEAGVSSKEVNRWLTNTRRRASKEQIGCSQQHWRRNCTLREPNRLGRNPSPRGCRDSGSAFFFKSANWRNF
jgi:hypothetical protein